jgi:hypothetical protein
MLLIVSFVAFLKLKLPQTPVCYYVQVTEYIHAHLSRVFSFSASRDVVELTMLLQTALARPQFVTVKTWGLPVS